MNSLNVELLLGPSDPLHGRRSTQLVNGGVTRALHLRMPNARPPPPVHFTADGVALGVAAVAGVLGETGRGAWLLGAGSAPSDPHD